MSVLGFPPNKDSHLPKSKHNMPQAYNNNPQDRKVITHKTKSLAYDSCLSFCWVLCRGKFAIPVGSCSRRFCGIIQVKHLIKTVGL